MLKTVEISRAKKTKGIAVTYRAGKNKMFGTCPASCNLNDSGKGSKQIDRKYLKALLAAKPKLGISFTYSHFDWNSYINLLGPDKTVINYSAYNLNDAVNSFACNVPTVVVVHPDKWNGQKMFYIEDIEDRPFPDVPDCLPAVVRCPAEYRNISCNTCGGDGLPFCARMKRDFIVGFSAHGPNKRKAASLSEQGGCYGAQGNCRIWWQQTAESKQPDECDGEKLLRFVKSLSPRAIVRHHVAGDIGAE